MLASLWRILSGEHLKIGDTKLEELFCIMEDIMKDLGNPLAVISVKHPRLFKVVNNLGILHTIFHNKTMINFSGNAINNHKNRHIDGNNILLRFIFSK